LNLNLNSNIVKNSKNIDTFIFYNVDSKSKKKSLIKAGAKLINIEVDSNDYLNIYKILKYIKTKGINYLLIEGGYSLTENLLQKGLFNEFYLFKSGIKLSKKGKNNISTIIKKLNYQFKNKTKINTFLDKDILINYR
jgi:riboflavin biosynthesis pyrimidine reductase